MDILEVLQILQIMTTLEIVEILEGQSVESELEARLRAVFSMRIPVRAVRPGDLPGHEVKAKRWKVIR